MLPYKDDNPISIFPFFTILFIVLNVVVFFFELSTGPERTIEAFGAIPVLMLSMEQVQPMHPVATVFSSMFMHGGLFHLAGNMLYLWIFGNNIEDKLGHLRFVIFYLMGGFVAAYSHALAAPSSIVPMVGASGAVSAILGAYLLLFPGARVYTIIFLGFFVQVVRLPALIVIGFWAIIQLVSGLVSIDDSGQGGVAWFAHIGGFVFGLLMIKLFLAGKYRHRRRIKW